MATLLNDWEFFDGYAAAHGMPDLRTLSLERVSNFVWWYLVKDATVPDMQKLKAKVWRPPPGEVPDKRSPWSSENETKAFAALSAGLGIKPNSAPKSS